MARIRTIKPSFFTSLTIADLTVEQRLTFIGLWTHVDDEGRCVYDPRLIKAALWPLDDRTPDDIADDIRALTESSLITHYTVGERSYLHVTTWDEHQRINRKVDSKLPAPEDGQIVPLTSGDEGSVSTHGVLTEVVHRERKGKEGKGRESAAKADAATPSPDRPEDQIAKTVYDSTGGMVKYVAIRQIASKALKAGSAPDKISAAMLDVYGRNKPITLETVGQALKVTAGRAPQRRSSDDWMQGT